MPRRLDKDRILGVRKDREYVQESYLRRGGQAVVNSPSWLTFHGRTVKVLDKYYTTSYYRVKFDDGYECYFPIGELNGID